MGTGCPKPARRTARPAWRCRGGCLRSVPRALSLAVLNLSPVSAPGAKQGEAEFLVAVAGVDSSISLFTLEHRVVSDIGLITLFPAHTFKNVHEGAITDIAFSHFVPPKSSTMRQMSVKLASVGAMDNSCVSAHHSAQEAHRQGNTG